MSTREADTGHRRLISAQCRKLTQHLDMQTLQGLEAAPSWSRHRASPQSGTGQGLRQPRVGENTTQEQRRPGAGEGGGLPKEILVLTDP